MDSVQNLQSVGSNTRKPITCHQTQRAVLRMRPQPNSGFSRYFFAAREVFRYVAVLVRNFNSAMDEFCLFRRALGENEIRALYAEGKPQTDPVGSSEEGLWPRTRSRIAR